MTERLAAIFKALSDRNRLEIFRTIRSCCCDCAEPAGETTGTGDETGLASAKRAGETEPVEHVGNSVSEIASRFDLSLSTVSHHLKELKSAGLIICEKRGQWVYCRPNPEVLRDIEGFLEESQS